jgi:preprotein translocase subunit YajC
MKLQRGDHVLIKNKGIIGEVIEPDTRTIIVRYKKEDGELVERRFPPEDLEYRPKPHLQ